MYYTSPEDARSDLFLAGAVYIFGRLVLLVLWRLLQLNRVEALQRPFLIVLWITTTVLVPFLLIRYRRESLGMYGFGGPSPVFAFGVLLGLPVVAASLGSAALGGGTPATALPVVVTGPGGLFELLYSLTVWLGLAALATYGTVKARDAFRADYRTVRDAVWEIGRILAAVSAVATLVLLLAGTRSWDLVLLPLGVAASVLLVHRRLKGRSTTTRATMLTPVVLLALGPFELTFQANRLVPSIWAAALAGGIGLIIGALLESRRSALGGLGVALTVALLTALWTVM